MTLPADRARRNPQAHKCKEKCQRRTDDPFSGVAFPPYDFTLLHVPGVECEMLIKDGE